ncbi:NAD(P)H-binding protein [Nocardia sp. ET3-3]|uniref:NAD(P)H-binding protein n=1 Tax=Nocardia terrae TaxID=2675851 RepID=A0A7K1UV36_9NOCA|nr:NAD(P)H-binding protein [Nocardia terrae]MVU78029.1 NAD(P)H-binding protein [Nocardia terrae]
MGCELDHDIFGNSARTVQVFDGVNTVLVVGATGNVGRQVVAQLNAKGVPTRALARDPESSEFPEGVQVVRGDLAEPESLAAAADGVESVFLVWPFHGTEGAAEVLKVLGGHARRVVYLSSTTVNDEGPQSDLIPELHAGMEALLAESGVPWTVLRADTIASNALGWAGQIRAGDVVRGTEVAPTAVVHEGDIAAVAVELLTDHSHTGRTYLVTGPRVVGRADQVQAIGEALGRSLRFEALPLDVARESMTRAGLPARLIASLLSMAEFRPPSDLVTTTVAELTGRPARDVRDWAAENAVAFRA